MERRLRELLPGGGFRGVSPTRSRIMASVRGKKNRSTEQRLRFALVCSSVRGWRLHSADILGRPDFYFAEEELAVFVDGCFWHGCRKCGHLPRTNAAFWAAKIKRNRKRDRATARALTKDGVTVLRFWEHELQENLRGCVERIVALLDRRRTVTRESRGHRPL